MESGSSGDAAGSKKEATCGLADDGIFWHHKDKRLDLDHVFVSVEVIAEGCCKESEDFVIRNPNGTVGMFRVEQRDTGCP